jgi:hypothetical protein
VLKKLLFDNLFAKIVALLVSVLLWFYVSEQHQFEERLSVPLRLENIPEELTVLGDVPAFVEVLVRGQGRFLRHRVKGLYIAVDMSGATKGRYLRRFTPADVDIPLEEDVEVLEIVQPGLLKADLDRVAVKSVPVIPTTENAPAAGYARVGSAVVNPEEVTIRGAESIVSGVSSLRTEPISLRNASRMVVSRAKVDLGGLERVVCDPEQVAVAIPVEKLEDLTLASAPVVADADTSEWRVRWQPETISAVLNGPVSLMVGLRDVPPVVHVDASVLSAGRYFFDLSVNDRGTLTLVSREPEMAPPDSTDTTSSGGTAEPPPREPIELKVSFELPGGVSVTEVSPSRFHIVVEERNPRMDEDGLLLPAS